MTHDSIGLGEDGPTHQPVEHLAALRAIPNMHVLRPADAIETAECWQLALETRTGPTVLALTPPEPADHPRTPATSNLCARGAYILAGEAADPIRLIASGSEVQLALGARELLAKDGIAAPRSCRCRRGSCSPSRATAYRNEVMGGDGTVRVACEAARGFGWERWLGSRRAPSSA